MKKIGVFDSGMGGLTVLREIGKEIDCDLVYVADTANFPYGNKNNVEIINNSRNIANILLTKDVDIIVIACGTATSIALDTLKKEIDLPVIGIIAPTCLYMGKMYDKVGVMATSATIKNNVWERELRKVNKDIEVINVACPKLATLVEEKEELTEEDILEIKEYVDVLVRNNVENVILGCTHYPYVENVIKDLFPYQVNLINVGKIVAKYIKDTYNFEELDEQRITVYYTK